MKAKEAPQKIYLEAIYPDNGVLPNGLNYTPSHNDIEYTRTDVFIEKALKWYCLDCECNDNCKDIKCFFYREYERYLKGETNALPPKFSNRILNEDGSTSDDWRYRHFTSKMQDAFIEKAKKWFDDNLTEEDCEYRCIELTEVKANYVSKDSFIRAFRNYIKNSYDKIQNYH